MLGTLAAGAVREGHAPARMAERTQPGTALAKTAARSLVAVCADKCQGSNRLGPVSRPVSGLTPTAAADPGPDSPTAGAGPPGPAAAHVPSRAG